MRAHMTMTNAQAALIAAANAAVRGSAVPMEPVLKRAAAYLLWLEGQDQPDIKEINLVSINELHKPPAIVQCEAASANNTRCLLASGHEGDHRNSMHGEYWGDKPVHFLASAIDTEPICGPVTGQMATIKVKHITCPTCKEELGL